MMKSAVVVCYSLWMMSSTVSGFAPKPSAVCHRQQFYNFPQEEKKTVALTAMVPSTDEEMVVEETKLSTASNTNNVTANDDELSETERLMKQVKEAGTAGVISYAGWELMFWTVSVPVCVLGYREATGYVFLLHDFRNHHSILLPIDF
jgi:hypothetical protein